MTQKQNYSPNNQQGQLLADLQADLISQRKTAAFTGGSPKIILPYDIKSEILDLIFLISNRYSQASEEVGEDKIFDLLYDLIVGTQFDFTSALIDILIKDESVRKDIQETIGNLAIIAGKVDMTELLFSKFVDTLDEIDKAICIELLLENWGIRGNTAYYPYKNTARSIAYRFKVSESKISRRKKHLTQRLSFFLGKNKKI